MSPAQNTTRQDTNVEMTFPFGGVDISTSYEKQSPAQMPSGDYGRTSPNATNVLGWESTTDRMRGGSRPMLSKYISSAPVSDWIIQDLNFISTIAPGMNVQTSQSGRVVTLIAVQQGNVYSVVAGGTAWTQATNNTSVTPPLNYSGVMYSTSLNQKLWFADGINWCYFDPNTNIVYTWAATAGSLPVDSRGNTPRLICTWRGRIVCAGLIYDPGNWFMSAVGDPFNFDYAPSEITPTQAIAGNNSPVGVVGDVITSLIPFTDDTLIFGGDHTVWVMNGDPMAGGQIDLVSDSIGMAWGIPWAKDPYGTVYFMSNQTGIYSWRPGQQPQRISQQIESLLAEYNTGTNTIRMQWNDKFQLLHVFISPTAAPSSTTHFIWEWRSGAWWKQTFANTNHDPLTCTTFDGNLPGDRVALIGSWDGYVRYFDADASTDDGSSCSSSVVLGPINSKNLDDFVLHDLQCLLGSNSGSVTWEIYTGATAEIALASTAIRTGTFSAGRNLNKLIRIAGHALYVKLTSTVPWQFEGMRARISTHGVVRGRGR